jgi:phosphoribosylformylglycinamidine synthase
VYEQYDTSVRTNTAQGPGGDAAVIRVKGTRRALALKTDCNGRYVYLNPRKGAQIAVAESARNVVCTGAQPLAITNCLNFGNPYKPEVYFQFKEACGGMGEACRVFETPVTGGNVSFYNENPDGAVYPTPVIGMLGLIDDIDHITQAGFANEGERILLLGTNRNDIDGSEYLTTIHGIVGGDAPFLDLDEEHRLHGLLLGLIRAGLVSSAHDVSDGGLAVTIAESCFLGKKEIGATVHIETESVREDALYFGESQSRVVISCTPGSIEKILAEAARAGIEAHDIGVTGGDRLRINADIDVEVAIISAAHASALPNLFERS